MIVSDSNEGRVQNQNDTGKTVDSSRETYADALKAVAELFDLDGAIIEQSLRAIKYKFPGKSKQEFSNNDLAVFLADLRLNYRYGNELNAQAIKEIIEDENKNRLNTIFSDIEPQSDD